MRTNTIFLIVLLGSLIALTSAATMERRLRAVVTTEHDSSNSSQPISENATNMTSEYNSGNEFTENRHEGTENSLLGEDSYHYNESNHTEESSESDFDQYDEWSLSDNENPEGESTENSLLEDQTDHENESNHTREASESNFDQYDERSLSDYEKSEDGDESESREGDHYRHHDNHYSNSHFEEEESEYHVGEHDNGYSHDNSHLHERSNDNHRSLEDGSGDEFHRDYDQREDHEHRHSDGESDDHDYENESFEDSSYYRNRDESSREKSSH